MDKDYIQRLKDRLPLMKLKLKELEKMFGRNSEQWNIANENLIAHKNFIEKGVPKNVSQSVSIPNEIIDKI